MPARQGVRLDCPPACREKLTDPSIPLWFTEGQKKADALASRGACAVAVLGVWNFKGQNPFGGVTVLADFDYITLPGRDVRIVFDKDSRTNPSVRKAMERLTEHLQRKGAHVSVIYLPLDGPKGVDEYLASGKTISNLEKLIEGPRPQPKAASDGVELLDSAPVVMSRPLALIDGRAYAATWAHVKRTKTETLNKDGDVVKLNPPEVTTEQRLLVLTSDGIVYGDGGDKPLTELEIEVHLPEVPAEKQRWSTPALKAYRAGTRPDPWDVFTRLTSVIDRFLDFDRSLADQHTMCELVGCYIISTYFFDAFNVAGMVWASGEKGSGKTKLISLIAELGYLGQLVLSSGSFAALRDLADYGATLCFDDAEKLANPKQADPDKKELFLAGNRKGNTIPIKEPLPDKRGWQTRHVSTYCHRCFSAIRLPDGALASRTITVPLIASDNSEKANAEVLDYALWPSPRRQLVDNYWSLALAHLATMPKHYGHVADNAKLNGRDLEPWRGLLTVARWLDSQPLNSDTASTHLGEAWS